MSKQKLAIVVLSILLLTSIIFSIFLWRGAQDENEGYTYQPYIYEYEQESPEPEIPRLVYIALGDSVSEGFGIWSQADRHTAVFFEMLEDLGLANEYVNLAVSGFTTTDLLALLHGLNSYELDAMRHAAVVTLNIGGNNILEPFFEHLPDADQVQRITDETIAFATDAWGLVAEIMEFAGESMEVIEEVLEFANDLLYFAENFSIFDIFRLNQMIAAASPVMDSAAEVFTEISSLEASLTEIFDRTNDLEVIGLFALLAGTFPAELEAEFQASIRQFEAEFVEILTWLEEHAPQATIITNTVYNPLPPHIMGITIGISEESHRLIQEINRIIYEKSHARGHVVSDVYTILSYRLDMMNLNFDLIHPNFLGHCEIARLNFSDLINALY